MKVLRTPDLWSELTRDAGVRRDLAKRRCHVPNAHDQLSRITLTQSGADVDRLACVADGAPDVLIVAVIHERIPVQLAAHLDAAAARKERKQPRCICLHYEPRCEQPKATQASCEERPCAFEALRA